MEENKPEYYYCDLYPEPCRFGKIDCEECVYHKEIKR